jgi:hypothetical protein
LPASQRAFFLSFFTHRAWHYLPRLGLANNRQKKTCFIEQDMGFLPFPALISGTR